MRIEYFLVVLGYLVLAVEKLKESLVELHAVRVPLPQHGGESCAVKEFCKDYVVGAATREPCGGKGILTKNRKLWDFNPTRGYPGQDILSCLKIILH